MAQTTKITCDRCGKELSHPMGYNCPAYILKKISAKITLWGVGEARSTFGQRIDLCTDCYEKFIDFMEGGVE